jgi:hypothetical protein
MMNPDDHTSETEVSLTSSPDPARYRLDLRDKLQKAVQRRDLSVDDYARRICGYTGDIPEEVRRAAQKEVEI